jgi:uncharacterized membrane protein
MDAILQFIGKSHLLLVHVPIGMMLLALVFQRMGRKPKNAVFRTVIPTTLLISSSIALLACVSGFLLADQKPYARGILGWHAWLGVALTVLGVIAWRFSGKRPGSWQVDVWRNFIAVALFVLLLLTGYLGSTLTHGKGYLTKPPQGNLPTEQPY